MKKWFRFCKETWVIKFFRVSFKRLQIFCFWEKIRIKHIFCFLRVSFYSFEKFSQLSFNNFTITIINTAHRSWKENEIVKTEYQKYHGWYYSVFFQRKKIKYKDDRIRIGCNQYKVTLTVQLKGGTGAEEIWKKIFSPAKKTCLSSIPMESTCADCQAKGLSSKHFPGKVRIICNNWF